MDVSYYKEKYEPINGKWYIKELLGEGSYGKVFRVESTDVLHKKTEAALKIITIPKSENEIEIARQSLHDDNSVNHYFSNMASKITEELDIMAKLKGNTNIVSYEEHDVFPHSNGIGYDILIRMELLTPLNKFKDVFAEKEVIEIGIDICKALEECHKHNIVHRDIKPENIFVSPTKNYKLGDFGVAKTMQHEMTVMTVAGTYVYMAPELKKGEECGANVDIYSLGMVMYMLLNGKREPFLPLPPQPFTHEQREQALIDRMRGKPLPNPVYASNDLAKIILKACAYNPKERYNNPTQMRKALESLINGNPSDGILNSETVLDEIPEDTSDQNITVVMDDNNKTGILNESIENKGNTEILIIDGQNGENQNNNIKTAKTKPSSNRIILIAAAIAVILIAIVFSGSFTPKKNNNNNSGNMITDITDITGLPENIAIPVDSTAKISFQTVPEGTECQKVSYSSEKNDVVSVDKDGTVTAISTGSSVITVTADNITKTVNVSVLCPDNNHEYGANMYSNEHPHKPYQTCNLCGYKKDGKLKIILADCKTCSDECTHDLGVVSFEGRHPHREYRICKICEGTMYLDTNRFWDECKSCTSKCNHKFGVASYEGSHPHKEYRICKLCDETVYLGTNHLVDDCEECQKVKKE